MDSTGESDADSSRMRTRGLHGDRESPQDTPDEQRGDGRLMEPRLRCESLIDAAVSESFFLSGHVLDFYCVLAKS